VGFPFGQGGTSPTIHSSFASVGVNRWLTRFPTADERAYAISPYGLFRLRIFIPHSVGVNRIDPFFGYTKIAVFLARATRRVAPTISPPFKGGGWGGFFLKREGTWDYPLGNRGTSPTFHSSFALRTGQSVVDPFFDRRRTGVCNTPLRFVPPSHFHPAFRRGQSH